MPLVKRNGMFLRVGGAFVTNENCCCGGEAACCPPEVYCTLIYKCDGVEFCRIEATLALVSSGTSGSQYEWRRPGGGTLDVACGYVRCLQFICSVQDGYKLLLFSGLGLPAPLNCATGADGNYETTCDFGAACQNPISLHVTDLTSCITGTGALWGVRHPTDCNLSTSTFSVECSIWSDPF